MQKRIIKKAPELAHLIDFERLHTFPGVNTVKDHRDELVLKLFGYPIIFLHGYLTKPGQHLNKNRECTVIGHSHTGWVHYASGLGGDTMWELNAGFLGDATSLPLSYTAQRKIDKTTLGFGVIDNYGPRFIPIQTDK